MDQRREEELGAVGGVPPPALPESLQETEDEAVRAAIRRRPGGEFRNGIYIAPAKAADETYPEFFIGRNMRIVRVACLAVESGGIAENHRAAFRLTNSCAARQEYVTKEDRDWAKACRVSENS